MRYRVATRRSRLSLAQTGWVTNTLCRANPDVECEAVAMSTRGDTDSRPLFAIERRGLFEREIDRAVADGRADFAVHSLKDVPTDLEDGLILACVPRREAAGDVLVSSDGAGLDSPSLRIVGTSSLRRAVQLSRRRPDLQIRPIRGNVETRIGRISDGYDGVVLARAGISRLGLDVRYTELSPDEFVPAPGQGALAIVARKDDERTVSLLHTLEDPHSRAEAEAERALSGAVESGCRFPVGAYARARAGRLSLLAEAFSADGDKSIRVIHDGAEDRPHELGRLAGEELRRRGVGQLALNWRKRVAEWNKT